MTREKARQAVVRIRAELAEQQKYIGRHPRTFTESRLIFLENRLGELLEVVAALLESEGDDGK